MNNVYLFKEPRVILVVDDDKMMRQLLRRAMEKERYKVVEASNGEECLAVYKSLHPHIILLDAMMPVMDGFTCCTHLQKLPGGDRTPVLMITGLEDKESVDLAFQVGATDYVTKPIHWPVLLQRVRRLLQHFSLLEQLEAANKELHRLATHDSLTAVANRRRFDEYFELEWRRMKRELLPLSLILCDIDFFKAYNDTYGHLAGDFCLQQVASVILRSARRPGDLVARYGGEEFAVILSNTPAEGALKVAEKIRDNLRALEIDHAGSQIDQYVTLSLGVSTTFPKSETASAMLIASADKALYQAKGKGRDRAVLNLCDA